MDDTLEAFAARHRLRLDREGSWKRGEKAKHLHSWPQFIVGRHGQLYDHEDGVHLAVMIHGAHVSALRWGNARRAGLAVGMACVQNGDAEGTLIFDPTNDAQVRLALKVVGAKRRRSPVSPARRERLANQAKARWASKKLLKSASPIS